MQTAVLVEADEGQFRELKRHVSQRDSWQFSHELIAPQSGETSFYQNSLAAESGLFGPEQLGAVWPNLTVRNVQNRTALSLADLIKIADIKPNWLFIDCMPAASILAGAERDFGQVEVVIVRVALTDQLSSGAALPAVTGLLQDRGYRFLIEEVSRHPAIGHALYVRDSQKDKHLLNQNVQELQQLASKLQTTQSAKEHLAMQAAEYALAIQKLETALIANADLIQQQKCKIEALVVEMRVHDVEVAKQLQEKAEFEKRLTESQSLLGKAKADAASHAMQLEEKNTALITAEELMASLRTQIQAHKVALDKEVQSTLAEKAAREKEKLEHAQALDKANKLTVSTQAQAAEVAVKLQQLKVDQMLSNTTHAKLKEELVRAEAQIQIISQWTKTTDLEK